MTKEDIDHVGQEPGYIIRLFVLHYDEVYEIKEGLEEPIDCKQSINQSINQSSINIFSIHKFRARVLSK